MLRSLLVLFLAPAALVAQNKSWPREFQTRPIKLIYSTDEKSGNQIITTKHFRIEAEREINRPDLERFAKVVESVPQVVRSVPLPLWAPPVGKPTKILICDNDESYEKAGGQPGTVGFYNGFTQLALLRADYFLKPPSAQPTRLQPRPNQDILVHEMMHMAMQQLMPRTPPWFYEGTAEYFSVCHQGNGWYMFRDLQSSIRDHFRKSFRPNDAGQFVLPPVEDIIGLDSRGWMELLAELNDNPYLPYGTALLLAHYHINGGKVRRDKVAAHLTKVRGIVRRAEIPEFPTDDPKVIQERLQKYWSPKGLNLVFKK